MAFGAEPVDSNNVPLSTAYVPNDTFRAIQGTPGAYTDGSGNPSTAVIMSFLQPTIVQKTNAITGSAGKTLSKAFASNNIAGNSIVVSMGMGEVEAANITLAITDTLGNSYTQAAKASQSTTLESAIFVATPILGGANTITATIAGSSSSNTAISMEIYEVWGPIAQIPSAIDQSSTGSNAGSTAPATGSVTPYVPNEIAFAALSAAGGTITAGSNWTLDSGSLAPTGGNLVSFGAESRPLSTIAPVSATATLGASNAWAICMATFKTIIVPIEGTITSNPQTSSTSAITSVAGATSSTQLLAANVSRKTAYVYNDSTAILYLAFAANAATNAYTVQIPPNGFWEMPTFPVYTGTIFGIWSAANGNARITELT
jgi:hypothetical protein